MARRNRPPSFAVGPIKVRPTTIGWPILLGMLLIVGFSLSDRVVVGPSIVLLLAMLLDGALAARRLRVATVTLTPLRTVVVDPEPITARARLAGSASMGVFVQLWAFGVADGWAEPQLLVPGQSIDLEQTPGNPMAKRFLRITTSSSVLGLFEARRDQITVAGTLITRCPPPSGKFIEGIYPSSTEESSRFREYQSGDQMNRVSWASLARGGGLQVLDDGPGIEVLNLVVDLTLNEHEPDPVFARKVILQYASQVGAQALQAGRPLRLYGNVPEAGYYEREAQAAVDSVMSGKRMQTVDGYLRFVEIHVAAEWELQVWLAQLGPGSVSPPHDGFVLVDRKGVSTSVNSGTK